MCIFFLTCKTVMTKNDSTFTLVYITFFIVPEGALIK